MDAAALSGVGDPRKGGLSEKQFHDSVAPVAMRTSGRPSLAEYMHYAKLTREQEDADKTVIHSKGLGQLFAKKRSEKNESEDGTVQSAHSNTSQEQLAGLTERELELVNARRVLRQAGWATVFYLVTCDILGPFNAPYSISSIGMMPGVLLYVLFGVAAAYTGYMLNVLFLQLDSHRYPIRTYGDIFDRLFGSWARHVCSVLQGIQLVLNCGIICLSNGQSLSQVSKFNLCFSVCVVIWALLGMVIGMIRGLQNFSILANSSVWINLLIIFLSMGFIAHSPPNIEAAKATYGDALQLGPVDVKTIVGGPLYNQVNGVFNMVFAYGGAMIFPEIMAEMRRPRDFIKGMALAQTLIFVCYLMYGIYVFALQGQYTLPLAYQGVSKYSWQTVGNVLALITGSIAAGLYGNIGLKVFYINIVEGLLKGPALMSSKGRIVWSALVLVWWSLAFVVGSAIPNVGALSGLIAAICIFHFTYTFPPVGMLALELQKDGALEDQAFTPGVEHRHHDSWRSASRWRRAIVGSNWRRTKVGGVGFVTGGWKRLGLKLLYLLMILAALATDGLGLWATGTTVYTALGPGGTKATSFGCGSNVG